MARLRNRQESGDEFASASALPFIARKARGVNKRAGFAAAVEKALLVEAIESSHDRGVGERTRQFIDYLTNVAVAVRPEDLHNAFFKVAERRKAGQCELCIG